jgi:glycosyltransferase involved in cell wall biosynthesis
MRRVRRLERTLALGVVVPVHNEEELVCAALESVSDAINELRVLKIASEIVVVLDACVDDSARLVAEWQQRHARRSAAPMSLVTCDARNVGIARGLGCAVALDALRDIDPARVWLATTDADSHVPRRWLRTQLLRHEEGRDVWAGRVHVTDWSLHRRVLQTTWQHDYDSEHQPIHGANLGFNAGVYVAAGGFPPLRTGEDRALVRAMSLRGADCCFDDSLRVVTSARRAARAPLGFAHALNLIEASGGQRFD